MRKPSACTLVTSNIRLVRQLGEGGMGSVWLADHLALKTQVVVKFIATELADNPEALGRFAREAAAASQVRSPHVVQMLDHGVMEDGPPYIVMEWLEGHDLDQHISAHGAMDPAAVAEVVSQVARALSRAHERGIVHRDIKPSNIFLCDAGDGRLFVKLLDFGIAKGLEGNNLLDSQTRTGSMIGSPHYMSPEQVVGAKTIDHRTDLWSLGVVAFEALTGNKPFEAETVGGLALKIHNEPLPRPSTTARHLPKSVDAWFERACAREAANRFANAKEMADALGLAVRGDAPATSLAPAPIALPRPLDVDALAKTTVDAQTGPRSGETPAVKSLTESGVTRGTSRPPRATWLPWAALVVVVAIGGAAFALRSRAEVKPDTNALPTTVPTPSATTSTLPPLTPSVVPVVSVPSAVVTPSIRPTATVPTARASAPPSAAASSAPAVPAASSAPRPRPSFTNDDDIK